MGGQAAVGFVLSGALALAGLTQGCATQSPTVAGPTTRALPAPQDATRSPSACDPSGDAFYVWKRTSEQEAEQSLLTLREGGYWQFETEDPNKSASGCLSETVQKNIEKAIAASTLETTPSDETCASHPYATIELTVRGIRLVWADECSDSRPHASVGPLISEVRQQLDL